jgi:hypothetical protein
LSGSLEEFLCDTLYPFAAARIAHGCRLQVCWQNGGPVPAPGERAEQPCGVIGGFLLPCSAGCRAV